MNSFLNAMRFRRTTRERSPWSNLAYGVCSALMPYLLAALLLNAFG